MGPAGAAEVLLRDALAGDAAAMHRLVESIAPAVHFEVANTLRGRASQRRDVRQEVEDLVQEVFAFLFADGARALRSWRADGGRSLVSFVRLLAHHQTVSILRSAKRNPWTDEPMEPEAVAVAAGTVESPERDIASRELLASVLERLLPELTPRGMLLFQILYVENRPVEAAQAESGLSKDAIYAWRSRVKRTIARIASELEAPARAGAAGASGARGERGAGTEERR